MTRPRRLVRTAAGLLVAAAAFAAPVHAEPPTITSPKSGLTLPSPGVKTCESPTESRCQILVEGRVPPGTQAVMLAASTAEPTKLWVQRSITVDKDGIFGTMVFLGLQEPTQATYELTLLSCSHEKTIKHGSVLQALPSDCATSKPVTVTRTK